MFSDCLKGCFVVGCSVCAFIVLVWLREQIVVHGGPDWLEGQVEPVRQMNLPAAARGWFAGVFGQVYLSSNRLIHLPASF